MSGNNPGDGSQNPKNPTPPSVPRGSGSKREKEVARLKAERQAARRAEREAAQKRKAIWGGIIAVVVAAIAIAVIAWAPWSGSNTVTPTPTPTIAPTTAAPTPSSTTQIADCTPPPTTRPNNMQFATPPKYTPGSGSIMNLSTNCGLIQIQTDPVKAPGVSRSMLGLTEAGYFNLTKCHRLTTSGIYVLQCGDPRGDGTGGPGYTIADEKSALPKAGTNNYPAGVVAMANAGAGTTGSQFFIVYKDTTLPPNYMIWGHVTKGLSQVQAIAAAGSDNANGQGDGHPNQPVVIVTATVSKK